MKIFEKFARYLTHSLGEDQEKYEVYLFSLISWSHTFLIIFATYTIAYLLGVFKWALVIGVVATGIRIFAGGWHSNSPVVCGLVSMLVVIVPSLIVENINVGNNIIILDTILIGIVVYIVYKYVPVENERKPLVNEGFRKSLKRKTLALLLIIQILIFFASNKILLSVFFGLAWQLFSLTPLGHKLLSNIDLITDAIKGR